MKQNRHLRVWAQMQGPVYTVEKKRKEDWGAVRVFRRQREKLRGYKQSSTTYMADSDCGMNCVHYLRRDILTTESLAPFFHYQFVPVRTVTPAR